MGFSKLTRLFLHIKFSRRRFHSTAERSSNWRDVMKKEFETARAQDSADDCVCIYRVPSNMRQVEPKAYRPNNISIGPCHYRAPHLRNMETLKRKFFRRLFDANDVNGSSKLEDAFKIVEELEDRARRCYMDEVKLGRDEFLEMMLIDASFIVQLLRDLSENEFRQAPYYLRRWMLPIIRRELIMLENQLPLFVLNQLFELTQNKHRRCLTALALRFFYPLLQVDSDNIETQNSDEIEIEHFLDLLRSSIRPKLIGKEPRGTQKHMIRSATELKESGVKIKADEKRQLLDIGFGKKWGILINEMTIPSLYINDHRGTVFRNIVAFEKCHKSCKPDVTTYLFFLNGLINSAEDVALLHYKGVLHHSLGDNHVVAELINNISKEMVRDENESYLHEVSNLANEYFGSFYARTRATLVHYYLSSWVVGISTVGAFLALYFTFIQTACEIAGTLEVLKNNGFRSFFKDAFLLPFLNTPNSQVASTEGGHHSHWGYFSRDLWDLCMEICLTE